MSRRSDDVLCTTTHEDRALLEYILRPAVAQERIVRGPEGLVRIALKKPFSDGTVAVDLDPLSLSSRLAAAVPPPRLHTVRYAGVLACPKCEGRMRLLGMVTDDKSIARYLRALGEPTEAPHREPARGPPYWKSRALRRTTRGDEAAE